MRPSILLSLLIGPALAGSPSAWAIPVPATVDLSGRWARVEVTTAQSDVPVIGGVTSKTTSVSLLDVKQQGDAFKIVERVCRIENDTLGGVVRTRFPLAFLRAVSGSKMTARVQQVSGGLRYLEERPLRVRGARLDDPTADELPASPKDPRLEDPDGDGHPGLTVRVEGFVEGDVYVVQRDKSALDGMFRDARRIEGLVTWSVDQKIIGASKSSLEKAPSNRPHPDRDKSWFRMRRVPRSATCAQLLARVERLFDL